MKNKSKKLGEQGLMACWEDSGKTALVGTNNGDIVSGEGWHSKDR